MEGVPKSLPAVVKASRIQEKVAGVGFDWEEPAQVWEKVQEELAELNEEIKAGNTENTEKEFGDDAFATAFGKCITQTSGAISSPKNLNELDENLSCHLVISYLKTKDDRPPLYQIFSLPLSLPKVK